MHPATSPIVPSSFYEQREASQKNGVIFAKGIAGGSM